MIDAGSISIWNKLLTGGYWTLGFVYFASVLLKRPFPRIKTVLICIGAVLFGWIWNILWPVVNGLYFYIPGYYLAFILLLIFVYKQNWENAIYLALIQYFSVGYIPRFANWFYRMVGGRLYIEAGVPHWDEHWIHLITIALLVLILSFVRNQVRKIAGYRLKTKEFIYSMIMVMPLAISYYSLSFLSVYIDLPLWVLLVWSILSIGVMLDMVYGRKQQQDLEELRSIEQRLQEQYRRHQLKAESSDLIMQKCHDLQKYLRLFQETSNQSALEAYQAELNATIDAFTTVYETGNATLDSILSEASRKSREENITLICVADGNLVNFIAPIDICSIFGNALDNAIESARTLSDPQKKIIHLKICQEKFLLFIRVENYYEHELHWEDNQLLTNKSDKDNHGYGMKSIRYAVEKYHGNLRVTADEGKFTLTILIHR